MFDVNIARLRGTYQFSKEVFFLGTDGGYERPADRGLRSTSRVLFFKASYLWRL